MWQPNRTQWAIIWAVALLLILAWPPETGRSLAVKVVNWAVDPRGSLPTLPAPLPMGLDDNGDAVAEHDAQETAYYQVYERSPVARWRLRLKTTPDPLARSTTRQLLVGIAVLSALAVWRLDKR